LHELSVKVQEIMFIYIYCRYISKSNVISPDNYFACNNANHAYKATEKHND